MSIVNIQALKQLGNVLWWPGQSAVSGAYDDDGNKRGFMILPDGVTVTPNGTFTTQKMKDGRNIWAFDGSTNYINIVQTTDLDIVDGDFTICYWVRLLDSATYSLHGKWTSSTNRWHVNFDYTNQRIVFYSNISGTVNADYRASSTIALNTWYFVTIVRSGTSCLIYLNLVPQSVTITQAFRNTNVISGPFIIGGNTSSFNKDNTKDFMIFKGKALSQDQIAAIMAETYIY